MCFEVHIARSKATTILLLNLETSKCAYPHVAERYRHVRFQQNIQFFGKREFSWRQPSELPALQLYVGNNTALSMSFPPITNLCFEMLSLSLDSYMVMLSAFPSPYKTRFPVTIPSPSSSAVVPCLSHLRSTPQVVECGSDPKAILCGVVKPKSPTFPTRRLVGLESAGKFGVCS
jgi:hypothetical protein